MNYYPFHVGDYMTHTAHLSPLEDLAYRRLLDLYYISETCLPPDAAACARKIRMRDSLAEVQQVLSEFFTETPEGWRSQRCDEEIERLQKGSRWALDVTNTQWAELRAAVFERDAYQCVYCGTKEGPFECDHVHPLTLGGVSQMWNLATACKPCNRSKGGKTLNDWKRP